jgi:hypothetical protein
VKISNSSVCAIERFGILQGGYKLNPEDSPAPGVCDETYCERDGTLGETREKERTTCEHRKSPIVD